MSTQITKHHDYENTIQHWLCDIPISEITNDLVADTIEKFRYNMITFSEAKDLLKSKDQTLHKWIVQNKQLNDIFF